MMYTLYKIRVNLKQTTTLSDCYFTHEVEGELTMYKGIFLFVFMCCFVTNTFADAGDDNGNPPPGPGDNDDWTGDQVQIQANLYCLKSTTDSQDSPCNSSTYMAPAFARFDVSRDKDGVLFVTPRDNYIPPTPEQKAAAAATKTDVKIMVTPSATQRIYNTLNFTQPHKANIDVKSSDKVAKPFVTYAIKKDLIEQIPYVRYGWSYGAIVVPFKYLKDSRHFSASSSYQIYAQYMRATNGYSDGPFASFGVATAEIPTAAGESSSKTGISYGIGWIFNIIKGTGFQLAIMLGQDKFGTDSGYQYEGKTWWSASFGYKVGGSKTAAN